MKRLIYILLFLISFNGVAQDKALIDSLIIELSKATADTTKLIIEKDLEEAKRNYRIPYWDSLSVRAVENGLLKPSEIFNHTRDTIIERLSKDGSESGGKDGMDASIISFDFENNKFSYTAAQNPIWIIRNNELIEIKAEKMPIGKHDNDSNPFVGGEFETQKGDIVYTLTDGFQDQFGGEKGKKFKVRPFKKLLISIAQLPMKEQKEILNNKFTTWKGEEEQVDDVCVIGV